MTPNRHPFHALKVSALILLAAAALAAGRHTSKLLFWGANWDDNAPKQSGERWLALRNDGQTSSLVSVTVLVTRRAPNEMRPVMVTVQEGFRPRFLLKGVTGLRTGPVRTVFDGQMPLVPNAIVHFATSDAKWNDVHLQAMATDPVPERGTKILHKMYGIVLHVSGNARSAAQGSQTLGGYMENPGQTPSLIWAGDLDRDGRLDLLLDVQTVETGGALYRLYLSSLAKRGELVGLAAELQDPAC